MEVVLPRLANVITLWEFLLMKVERGGPAKPRPDNIYREFEELYKRVHKVCQEYLRPLSAEDSEATAPVNKMQVMYIKLCARFAYFFSAVWCYPIPLKDVYFK